MNESRDLNDQAVMLLLQGEVEAAIELCRSAIAADPGNKAAHSNLGLALAANGQHEAALDAYAQALAIDPDSATAHLNRGLSLVFTDQLADAADAFQTAIELDEDNPRPWEGLAEVCDRVGNHEDAAGAWLAVVGLEPANLTAAQRCAIALSQAGKLDDSLAMLEHALMIDANNAQSHALLGRVYFLRNDFGYAERVLRHALSLEPNDTTARYDLALTHLATGDTGAAVNELEVITRVDPDHIEAVVDLGVLALSLGNHDEAEARLTEALGRDPENGKALYYLALNHKETAQPRRAREVLGPLLERPEDPFAEKARVLWEELDAA